MSTFLLFPVSAATFVPPAMPEGASNLESGCAGMYLKKFPTDTLYSGTRESELLAIYLYERIFQKWFELVESGSAKLNQRALRHLLF